MSQTVLGSKGNMEFCFVNKEGPPLSQTEWFVVCVCVCGLVCVCAVSFVS